MAPLSINTTDYPSSNYNSRPGMVRALVIHTGEGTKASDLRTLTNDKVAPSKRVSAHYYIDRAGTVYQLVDPSLRAWHAGDSTYLGLTDWNSFSVGIETEHKTGQDWPDVQRQQLAALCRMLIDRYHIPLPYVVAHRWIAPGRKLDPSDWPNEQLKPWIAAIYSPAEPPTKVYRFRYPQVVYTARDTNSPLATGSFNGATVFQAGDVVRIGDVTAGWAWLATGLGFVPTRVLELAQ